MPRSQTHLRRKTKKRLTALRFKREQQRTKREKGKIG